MRGLDLGAEMREMAAHAEESDFSRLMENRAHIEECLKNRKLVTLHPQDIERDDRQPRKDFDEEGLVELASSIDEAGRNLEAVAVFWSEVRNKFVIKLGERRWRAVSHYTTVVKTLTCVIEEEPPEHELFDLRVQENLQARGFTAVEEVEIYLAYKKRFEDQKLPAPVEAIAAKMHKSASMVSSLGGIARAVEASELFRKVFESRMIQSKNILMELASAINKDAQPYRKIPLNNLLYLFATGEITSIKREEAVLVRKQVAGQKPVPKDVVDLTLQRSAASSDSGAGEAEDAGEEGRGGGSESAPEKTSSEQSGDVGVSGAEGAAASPQSALMKAGAVRRKPLKFIRSVEAHPNYETRSIQVKIGNGHLDYDACAALVTRLNAAMNDLRANMDSSGEAEKSSA